MPWTLQLLHFLYIFHIWNVFHSFPSYTWFYSNKASHSESPECAPDHWVFLLLGHQQWACAHIKDLKASPVNTQNLCSCRDWSIWLIKRINQGINAAGTFYHSTPIWMLTSKFKAGLIWVFKFRYHRYGILCLSTTAQCGLWQQSEIKNFYSNKNWFFYWGKKKEISSPQKMVKKQLTRYYQKLVNYRAQERDIKMKKKWIG